MRILIAEDDVASRKFLGIVLSKYGECDFVVNGLEAIDAYMLAMDEKRPYGLICLDIMMPKVDGVKALKVIREFEAQKGVLPEKCAKIIMTTALEGTDYAQKAFELGCNAYVAKPIDIGKLVRILEGQVITG